MTILFFCSCSNSIRCLLELLVVVILPVVDRRYLSSMACGLYSHIMSSVVMKLFWLACCLLSWAQLSLACDNDGDGGERRAMGAMWQGTVDKHNTYRSNHQAGPLVWDDTIAATAQAIHESYVYCTLFGFP